MVGIIAFLYFSYYLNHMTRLFFCSVLVVIGWSLSANAQMHVDNQSLLWTRIQLKLTMNETYQLSQELEERAYWFPWRQHQFLTRSLVSRKLNYGWKTGVGFTYFLQSLPHDPLIHQIENRTELRPQIEFKYQQSFSKNFQLEHRYWNEFRFFEKPNGEYSFENIRSRYKLEFTYQAISKLSLKAFDEIFINIGNRILTNVFDQNRYGGSLNYSPNPKLGFEIGYINWFQQRQTGVDFYNRHIIRLTVHQTLNLTKS